MLCCFSFWESLETNFLFRYTIFKFTKADMKSEEYLRLFLYAYIRGGQ